MAENLESRTQARNLDTVEQQLQAVRFLLEHSKQGDEIKELNKLTVDFRDRLTGEQTQAIKDEIATCKDYQNEITAKAQREYGVRDLVQLDAELEKRGVNFIDPKYDYLINPSQQAAQQAAQQTGQNEVRPHSPEKGTAALEALEASMQHFKNTMNLAEDMKRNYEAMKEEFRMAGEYMQQANYQLQQSFQRLMEVREWNIPERQHGNVLVNEIREAFGLDKNREPHKSDRQYLKEQKQEHEQTFEEQLNQHYQKLEEAEPEKSYSPKPHQEVEQSHHSITEQRKSKGKEQDDFQESYHKAERGRASNRVFDFGNATGEKPSSPPPPKTRTMGE